MDMDSMINRYPMVVFWSDEDQCFIGIAPDLEFCSAFGDTPEAAVRELTIAMRLWIEVALEDNKKLPEPSREGLNRKLCA